MSVQKPLRPELTAKYASQERVSLLERISKSVRLNYLGSESAFDADSMECDGWLLSLVEGVGVVELKFTSDGCQFVDDYTTLIYMMSGVVSSPATRTAPVAKFGQIILFRSPNSFHLRLASTFKYLIVFLKKRELIELAGPGGVTENAPISAYGGEGAVLAGALRGLVSNIFIRKNTSTITALKPALRALIYAAFREPAAALHEAGASVCPMHIVVDWIENNIEDPALHLCDAANVAGVSSRTLQRELAAQGTNFQKLLRETRLATAAERLFDPLLKNQNINEIAYSCGFSTPSHFAKAFREGFGMTASEYRRSAITARNEA